MHHTPEKMTIGAFARTAGVNVETIRYYQRRGLLSTPERPYGGIRHYNEGDLRRLTFVRTAQRLGFSLSEIAELLHLDDGTRCEEASTLAEQKLKDVRGKMAALRRIERVLAELVHACHEREGSIACPLITSLHQGLDGMDAT